MKGPDRHSPLTRELILLGCFLALVVVGIVTVALPELESEDEEGAAQVEPASDPELDDSEVDDASDTPPPPARGSRGRGPGGGPAR